MATACLGVVRFACTIPLAFVGIDGSKMYEAVKGLDALGIYDVIPGGRMFLSGLQMYATWGIFAFAWNIFAMSLWVIEVSLECYWWLCALPGVVDSMVAISLLVSAVKQAQFLPRAYSSCEYATDWGNGTDGRNFFLAANETTFSSSYGGPGKLCHSMVQSWVCTVSMVVLYSLIGLINILIGLAIAYNGYRTRRHGNEPSYYSSGYATYNSTGSNNRSSCWAGLGRFVVWILTPALWILDHPLAACRFAFRYMHEAFAAKRKDRRDGKSLQHRKQRSGKGSAENGPDANNQHMAVLPYELLVKIARELHFVDLISANRSSKRLRIGLFGVGGPDRGQLDDLRRFTCQGNTKRSCDLCGIQTCPDCQTRVGMAPSLAFQHLRDCQPQCSKCFYKTYCRWWGAQGQRLARHSTTCGLREEQRTDIEMWEPGTRNMSVCRMCASMTPAERRRASEAREERELDRIQRNPLACSKCKEMLSARAMRWWICRTCLTECPSHMHPAWADRNLPWPL